MSDIPRIRTERALVTLLQPEQAPLLQTFCVENREHLSRWERIRDEAFYTVDDCRKRIETMSTHFEAGDCVNFVALNQDSTEMLASMNFNGIARGAFHACYLGYSIAAKHQGTGLMYEVLHASINYVFETLDLHRVMANYMPRNTRSENLLRRLGFKKEGYAESYLHIAGRWEDHVLNSLINLRHQTETAS